MTALDRLAAARRAVDEAVQVAHDAWEEAPSDKRGTDPAKLVHPRTPPLPAGLFVRRFEIRHDEPRLFRDARSQSIEGTIEAVLIGPATPEAIAWINATTVWP